MDQRPALEPFLIADHHPDEVAILRESLQAAGVKNPIHAVSDGHEFIEYLQGHNRYADRTHHPMPQLALLEWNLPRRSAMEILRWLREQPQHSMLPVMIWTRVEPADAELKEAYQAGLNGCFLKPKAEADLISLVRLVFEYWKLAEKPLVRKR
jgi:CheY-like chemotaxis protein